MIGVTRQNYNTMLKKKFLLHTILIFGLSTIIGLGSRLVLIKRYFAGEFYQSFLSAEKYTSITFITLGEAEDYFLQGGAIFIDSRPADEFKAGRVMGARNIPFKDRERDLALEKINFSQHDTLVIYCDGHECQSSVNLAKLLHEEGFREMKVFYGGWLEWINAGLPTERDDDSQ